jgi:error-prone DNA polymerase
VFEKIMAFSAFGFPKAHAAAFALLAYQSAWLRRHHPAAFLCALMNAQPMGFYPPASLVRDGQRRGVEVRGPDIARSAAPCRLEGDAVRVGLSYITGLGQEGAEMVVAEREAGGPFRTARDLARRLDLPADRLERLVASGACDELGRRRALLWELGLAARPRHTRNGTQLALDLDLGSAPPLPQPGEWELLVADYAHTGLSLREHPISVIRRDLEDVVTSADLAELPNGTAVVLPGLCIARQRPASANGIVFLLLEDELGLVNLVLFPDVYERHRLLARTEPLLLVEGTLERRERNLNVIVERLEPLDTPGRRSIGRARASRRTAVASLRAVAPPAQHFAQGRR